MTSVRFPSGDGECEADLYLPTTEPVLEGRPERVPTGTAPVPVVVMAHGIGAERAFGLSPFAARFAARGLAVLVFDYRHFGGSSGEPRNVVAPARQVEDYLAALSFVRDHPRLDGSRVGLWGTSFSGGHVLVVAARAPDGVRAVVSQIPFVSGLASAMAYPLRYHLPAISLGIADGLGARMGRSPITVPMVRRKGLSLLASPDSYDGFLSLVPEETDWSGRLPARVFLEVLRYHPSRHATRVQAPTLILAAAEDAICPVGATRRTARRIPTARLEEFPVGHFDPYHGEWFERFVSREADFLQAQLEG